MINVGSLCENIILLVVRFTFNILDKDGGHNETRDLLVLDIEIEYHISKFISRKSLRLCDKNYFSLSPLANFVREKM